MDENSVRKKKVEKFISGRIAHTEGWLGLKQYF